MKVLIIGGVAGGATAAARLRRLDEFAEIIILERGGFVSYANCGLPYYIGGIIEDKEALTLKSPESFWERFRVEVRVHHEVTAIDKANKTITVKRRSDGSSYTESYDKLILSPGAKAVRSKLPGIENARIFTLRTVEDTYRIRDFLDARQSRKAVVVGGGFIGLEMAENLVYRGIETVLVQREDQVMPPLDYDMACQVHAYLRSKGVDLRLQQEVKGFAESSEGVEIQLVGKDPIEADLVILSIGVLPESALAKEAGLQLGAKGAIVVNERMQTSEPDIYAVGDAVQISHFVSGEKTQLALAGPANKQGRIAADNIAGLNSAFHGSQGSSVIKIFEMTVATTGINEKAAEQVELLYDKVLNDSLSHADYYPGATDMTIKTLFDPSDGKILGAQIVGFDGVDKRIDVLATTIRARMTAGDLEELELAYAPPFSSAKDPVNMVGFSIGNLRGGLVQQHHWHDIFTLPQDGSITLLDTRTTAEFTEGYIPAAINIPVDELRERLHELDKSKKVYVNCQSGLRSYIACRILTQHGFECSNLSGGYRFYSYIAQNQCYDADPTHSCGIKI